MTADEIARAVEAQKAYFRAGHTIDVNARKKSLGRLYDAIVRHTDEIARALFLDLGKSASESYMCETGLLLAEISYLKRHLKQFAAPKKVKTPLAQAVSRSYRLASPYGNVLVLSPWNYPLLLSLDPLCEAVAAGNTVLLKTSASAPHTGKIVKQIVGEVFDPACALAIEGGDGVREALADLRFDYIFFTGSKKAGREIALSAARTLTPITLELGGKSPCIVDETADIPLAAKRIVWGKFLNLGQTCVAPDYVFCARSVHDRFLDQVRKQIECQFGKQPLLSPDYGKIVSRKHFDRLRALILPEKTVCGGQADEQKQSIEPTVLDPVNFDDAVMDEEIFGPILPVLPYEKEEEALAYIAAQPSPLALYVFSSDRKRIDKYLRSLSFGGGCVNDTVVHLSTPYLPFGGVGESGMGAYHGKAGFDTFTHYKSILHKSTRIDLPMRYRPYTKKRDKIIRRFLS